ncbi:MAG: biosynthetic-type acetolactate synthase large subunit [Dehalococcoidia bacterium]|nr:biosynthetic-type acetolactate synthase large subunit [Dehalococcoidia bacterium]
MKITGGQIVCESLLKEGTEVIFGILGGQILPLYDTLTQYPQLKHILMGHEQGAAHAAEGYARATGKVGVCLATSGPGATNLVTGIADAYMDSTPMVAITGQVGRPFIGKDAFQEIDITGVTLPITKHNYIVTDINLLAQTIKEAFYLARTGRPGPVLIDLPRDLQVESTEFNYPSKVELTGYKPNINGHPAQLKKAAKLITEAKKPILLPGQGVLISGACRELKELAETAQLPVVSTMLGISAFPATHALYFGWLGMHGMAYANLAVQDADLIVAVGMRFDDRATSRVNAFAPKAHVIHIDIDPAEIGKNVRVDVPIVGDARAVLAALNKLMIPLEHGEWLAQLSEWQREHPSLAIREAGEVLPQYVIRQIWEATGGEATVVTGVGQHQMFAAQHFFYDKPGSFISSGGLGTMGFELPAALGAKVGRPDELVWCVAGDGSFQMTIQELSTVARDSIGIKVAIMNNGVLGMVHQWQSLFYGQRYMATTLSCPDFVKLAEAYGIPAANITCKGDVRPAIERAIATPGPFILNFVISPDENVYPMVPPGAALHEVIEAPKKEVPAWSRRNTP